jgi:radical SAM protein with 4Fe4S-binding SPASM domain
MSNERFESAGDKVSNSFCIMPWVHLHTWPNGNVFPCCLADSDHPIGNVKKNTLEEIWNSPDLKKIRTELLKGDKPSVCHRCYMQEDMGTPSFRVSANDQWVHHIDRALETTDEDGFNNEFKLNYWDFRFSNVCNLRCRMCGPELSSSWYEEQIKYYGGSSTPKALIHMNDGSMEDVMIYVDRFINDVEEIYFAGGEPFIMEEHYIILEKLIAAGNTKCRIRYNTNFTSLKFKNWDLIELWKPFIKDNIDNVRVFASLDAIEEVAEYARKGTKWPAVEANIKRLHESGMNVWTSTTVSIFNIFELPRFVDRMRELGIQMDKMQMNNVLTFPYYYCINILPDKLKEYAVKIMDNHVKKIDGMVAWQHVKNYYDIIKKYLYTEPHKPIDVCFNDLKRFTETKDNGRNESFVKTFPYYKEWYESMEIKSFEETFPNFEPFEEMQVAVELIEDVVEEPIKNNEPIENNKKWQKLI